MRAHQPVMPDEVIEYLATAPSGVYADFTVGLGGHAARLLEALPMARLIGIDQDAEALEMAGERLKDFSGRATLLHGRFSDLNTLLDTAGVEKVDGALADLGVSYYQLTEGERGFSYQQDFPLDMRMNRRSSGRTAEEIVNLAAERDISELLYTLGEERRARRVARCLVRARPLRTTRQLAEAIASCVARTQAHSVIQRCFMALRMAVNEELEQLGAWLEAAPARVRPGGRIVVISFHSLEDRMVKQGFQKLAREGRAAILTKKVVRPRDEEQARNAASRSSKLRCVEILH